MPEDILYLEGPLFLTYFEKERDQKGGMKHAVEMIVVPITLESGNQQ